MSVYSDIDFNFIQHPITKDITKKLDDNAIKESIKNLIRTKFFERKYNSNIGMIDSLFENFNPMTGLIIDESIRQLIRNYEPRADILNIDILDSIDNNHLELSITFQTKYKKEPTQFSVILTRTR